MRDLSFLLHLHAFSPLARFSRTSLKPYLPLEVRYLVRSSGEVFLYLSNNPDNKTWGDDLSLFGTTERVATFIPATGDIPLLLEFLPMPPEGGFSYLTNQYAFLGMLCRRGLACHYLPTRKVCQPCTPYQAEMDEMELFTKTEKSWLLLFAAILAIIGIYFLVDQRLEFYERFN